MIAEKLSQTSSIIFPPISPYKLFPCFLPARNHSLFFLSSLIFFFFHLISSRGNFDFPTFQARLHNKERMPIEMPRGLPFSVDTWTPSSKRKRRYFLTHAHKDHSSGITAHSAYPIYSTHLTKTLILQQYPQVCFCLSIFSSSFFFR